MRYTIIIISFCAALSVGCTHANETNAQAACSDVYDEGVSSRLCKMLFQSGPTIDYDTLMHFYELITGVEDPIDHMDQLLGALIDKRNDNPRIDQMILIFAAKAIGESRYPIPRVSNVLMKMMNKGARINQWVIAFVAEAIEKYPFDITNGSELMDYLEEILRQAKSRNGQGKEYFGYHFLPPPKSSYIRDHIRGIVDMPARQKERNCYYTLISIGMTEASIEAYLRTTQLNGMTQGDDDSVGPLEFLLRERWEVPLRRAIPEDDIPGREQR